MFYESFLKKNYLQKMEPVLVSSSPFEVLHENKNYTPEPLVFASSLTREIQVACDSVSDQSLSFTLNLSPNTVLDRTVLINYDITVNIACANQPDMMNSDISLAAFPFNRVCKALTVTLNNNSKTIQPHQLIAAMNMYHNKDWFDQATLQSCPSQPDPANSLQASGRITGTDQPRMGNSQFFKNGVAESKSDRHTRGIWTPKTVSYANQVLTLVYSVTEPLLHPFFAGFSERSSLANISTVRVDAVLNNLAGMMQVGYLLANGNGVAPVNPTVSFVSTTKPSLSFRTYAPSENIPKQISVPYQEIVVRTFPISDCPVGTPQSFATGQFMLNTVPEKLLIFAKQRTDIGATPAWRGFEADNFAVIESLTIRTDSDSGGLSSANLPQLYQTAHRNGCIQSYPEFSNLQGTVLLLSLTASDLAGFIPNSNQQYTLDVSGRIRNTQYNTWEALTGYRVNNNNLVGNVAYDLYVVAFMGGRMIAMDNQLEILQGVSKTVVENAVLKGVSDVSFDEQAVLQGSGWWKDFKKGFRKGVRSVNNVVNTAAPIASLVAPEYAAGIQAAQKGSNALKALTGAGYRIQA